MRQRGFQKLALVAFLAVALSFIGVAPATAQVSFTDLFSGLTGGTTDGEGDGEGSTTTGPDINGLYSGQVPGIIPTNIEIDISETGGEVTGLVAIFVGQTPAGEFDMMGSYDRESRRVTLDIQLDAPLQLVGEVSADGNSIKFDLGIEVFRGGGSGGLIDGVFLGRLGQFEVPLLGQVDVGLTLDIFEEEPGMIVGHFDTRIGGEFFSFGEIRGRVEGRNDNGDRLLNLTFLFERGREVMVNAVLPFDMNNLAIPEFNLRLRRGRFFDGKLEGVRENILIISNEFSDERAEIAVNRNTRCTIHASNDEGFVEPTFGRGPECLELLKTGLFTFILAVVGEEGRPPLALEIQQDDFEPDPFIDDFKSPDGMFLGPDGPPPPPPPNGDFDGGFVDADGDGLDDRFDDDFVDVDGDGVDDRDQ